MSLLEFTNETSSESPAPGGGSISAYCGAMGIALGTMVANLSSHKRGWDEKWEEFSKWAEKGIMYQNKLLQLVDEDTEAFNMIIAAFQLPKDSEEEKKTRTKAIQKATKNAILTPLEVMNVAYKSMEVIKEMATHGNPNSISDAAVGSLCSKTAVIGAFLNVRINCKEYDDNKFVEEILMRGEDIIKKVNKLEKEILEIANSKI